MILQPVGGGIVTVVAELVGGSGIYNVALFVVHHGSHGCVVVYKVCGPTLSVESEQADIVGEEHLSVASLCHSPVLLAAVVVGRRKIPNQWQLCLCGVSIG